MEETLKNLKDVNVVPFKGSRYVEPQTVSFRLSDSERTWDMIKSMGSVAIVLYHSGLDSAILVRQFRPPVWASQAKSSQELSSGFTYEICAGLIDKSGLAPVEIAREEILEECGYDVPVESISEVGDYLHACADLGTTEKIFYCEVDESQRATTGGGISEDGEAIEVLALPLAEAKDFLYDPAYAKSAAAIIGLQWLLHTKKRT